MTEPGQAEPQSVVISGSAKTAQIAVGWDDPDSSVDVRGIQLVPAGSTQSVSSAAASQKLKIVKKRTKRSLNVTVKNLRHGRLVFKLVAMKLGGKTKTVAKIRQSKRG